MKITEIVKLLSLVSFLVVCCSGFSIIDKEAGQIIDTMAIKDHKRFHRQAITVNETSHFTFETPNFCDKIRINTNYVIHDHHKISKNGNDTDVSCTYDFTTVDCTLLVDCPCHDSILGAFTCKDKLLHLETVKFVDDLCAENPSSAGPPYPTSEFLTVEFRSWFMKTGKKFPCHVRCSKGAFPVIPPVIKDKCPDLPQNVLSELALKVLETKLRQNSENDSISL